MIKQPPTFDYRMFGNQRSGVYQAIKKQLHKACAVKDSNLKGRNELNRICLFYRGVRRKSQNR